MRTTCPACGAGDIRSILRLPAVPVNSCLVLRSREEALAFPVGDIDLHFCDRCTFVFNAAFDEALTRYAAGYEEAQGYSGTFTRFEEELVADLVSRHGVRGKSVIEIGCGKGDFLLRLCAAGANRGVGFDPAFDPARVPPPDGSVSFVRDVYSRQHARQRADFYVCKMTLEHIADSAAFVGMLRDAIGANAEAVVFIQVPDAARILSQAAFEDIYYEHCAYFTEASLRDLFARHGFAVLETKSVFGGQYLTLAARARQPGAPVTLRKAVADQSRDELKTFGARVHLAREAWGRRLAQLHCCGAKTVLWGGGSKAVAFLTGVPHSATIELVVDINPYRQGSHLPVTGQRIVAPDDLVQYRPDVVIVANRVYEDEIRRDLAGRGLQPEVLLLEAIRE